ncbi:amino-acid N-acetyltransferase [Ostreibacterium oceani]|uniref:Amino-acid acetyltransferase n=1 Tax=Ostreibacterium oceani TaxID=2654998 RepID=A0A6N7EZI1_9GAMM|nr:amino-acid N-acetyltransferase [Ostreibacterium oceani]MPV86970.1 amino-acid N-acetyltransferase [Ostreibacterium oceani]
MKTCRPFIDYFRQAAPYIHQHRNKTFVFCLQDDGALDQFLQPILHDIAILHSLRIRVVIVFGARHRINTELNHGVFHNNCRITSPEAMRKIQEIIGARQIQISATLSMGLANSPMQGASIQTSTGNFVIAKPIGIVDGVDFGLTGTIRKIRETPITQKLDQGEIVIIPPIGYSTTGEVFNLTTEMVASAVSETLNADKLLFFNDSYKTLLPQINHQHAITPHVAKQLTPPDQTLAEIIHAAVSACEKTVNRAHIIPKDIDGAILAELFTRDGAGLMITNDAYDRIEQATIHDISSLLALIQPLEEQGILVRRSRELLETELSTFSLLKRDNSVIGCASLKPFPEENVAELGCLAISPDYQKQGLADKLLTHIEKKAKDQRFSHLFCLTTHTSHWFLERGFEPTELSALPAQKKAFYNYSRQSKPYIKALN